MDTAAALLPRVPQDQHNKIARFLEGEGYKDLALTISTDEDHQFDLAIQLSRLDLAVVIARAVNSGSKWKTLGDCAMDKWRISLAEECFVHAQDFSGLLLIYSSSGDAQGMARLATMAKEAGKSNIAFACYLSLGQIEECIEILVETERIPEAALMARTYLPRQVETNSCSVVCAVPRVLKLWKESLEASGKTKTSEALADPSQYEDMFSDWQYSLQAEEAVRAARGAPIPASAYSQWKELSHRDIVEDIKSGQGLVGISGTESLEQQQQQQQQQQHIYVNGSEGSPAQSYSTSSPRVLNGSVNGSVNGEGPMLRPYPSLVEERLDNISDNMSYMSLEVNTTGTGSVRGDFDFDDTSSLTTSDHDRVMMQEMNAKEEEEMFENLI
ncbi:hypothetical protein BGZ98_002422 [Dissophora globulifera]|nr:hypothetical protein BGZ98_002422 [Dissophora globulifera]